MAPADRWRRGLIAGLVIAAGAAVVYSTWRADRLTLRSRALGERRSVLVRLPPGYDESSDRYPVLYLLDGGDRRFWSRDEPLYSRARALLDRLEGRAVPRTILVGVANRDRVRDMTPVERPDLYVGGGGAGAFLRFLTDELAPFIDGRYRTTARRILYGESYGGLFALYALATRPEGFSDYIAVSPAVGVCPDLIASALAERFTEQPDLAASLFVAYGGRDAPLVTEHVAPLLTAIEPLVPSRLRLRQRVIDGAGHNPPSGLEEGLRFAWQTGGAVSGAPRSRH
jgi:predicted alpha/beta superfamily hydrolase